MEIAFLLWLHHQEISIYLNENWYRKRTYIDTGVENPQPSIHVRHSGTIQSHGKESGHSPSNLPLTYREGAMFYSETDIVGSAGLDPIFYHGSSFVD